MSTHKEVPLKTVRAMLARRQLMILMIRQNMKMKYGEYRLGLLWTVGEPLLMAILMFTVFTFILGRGQGIGLEPFIVYLITGLVPFQWLSSSISGGPRTFKRYGQLITFSKLPPVVWPMRGVAVGFVEMVLSAPVVVLLIIVFEAPVTWGFLLLPIGFAAQFLLCIGFATLFAAWSVHMPDIQQLSSLLNRAFFWTSPVLWYARDFPDWFQTLVYLNPFYAILDFYRVGVWPEDVLAQPTDYLMSLAVIAAILLAGILAMRSKAAEIRRLG